MVRYDNPIIEAFTEDIMSNDVIDEPKAFTETLPERTYNAFEGLDV